MTKRVIAFSIICTLVLSIADVFADTENNIINLGSATCTAGEIVEIPLIISNNTGFSNLGLEIEYNNDVMRLVDVSIGETGATYTAAQNFAVNPYNMSWNSSIKNNTYNGVLATLKFEVSADAESKRYPINVDYFKGRNKDYEDGIDVNYDINFAPINITYVNGYIEVLSGNEPTESPSATDNPFVTAEPSKPVINLNCSSVICYSNETITVPISISNNSGVAGIHLSIEYDKALNLISAKKGEALSSLEFTTSEIQTTYPFGVIWDGIDEDNSNGTIVYLTFLAPSVVDEEVYNISIYLDKEKGRIYDGDMNDVEVDFSNGSVTVRAETPTETPTATPTATPTVAPTAMPTATPSIVPTTSPTDEPTAPPIENHKIELDEILFEYQPNAIKVESNIFNRTSGDRHIEVLIAVYTENRLLAVRKIDTQINAQGEANISELFENVDKADVIKVFAWDSVLNMIPVADLQIKNIEE